MDLKHPAEPTAHSRQQRTPLEALVPLLEYRVAQRGLERELRKWQSYNRGLIEASADSLITPIV